MALIELHNVWKTYDLGEIKVNALCDASLSIERGEYVALVGPSGSGKSTLMITLGCLDRPTQGSYLLADVNAFVQAQNRVLFKQNPVGCFLGITLGGSVVYTLIGLSLLNV